MWGVGGLYYNWFMVSYVRIVREKEKYMHREMKIRNTINETHIYIHIFIFVYMFGYMYVHMYIYISERTEGGNKHKGA